MLQTPFVFVDTEPFCASNFGLAAGRLKRLLELAQAGVVELILPSVTQRELYKKLDEAVEQAASILQSGQKRAGVLQQSTHATAIAAFTPIDLQAVKAELRAALDVYLRDSRAEVLTPPADSLAKVLDRYFAHQPPFGTGNKKHEFPDAVALETVLDWCATEGVSCYVVSRDSDLKAACGAQPALLHLEGLDALFELVEATNARAQALLDRATPEIQRQMIEQFEFSGFMLVDEEGDAENIQVINIEITDSGVQKVTDEVLLFQVKAEITFRADVSFWDYSTATYDSEDKVAIPWRQIERKVENTVDITAYGRVYADTPALNEIRTVEVDFDTGQVFDVYADPEVYE